MASRVEDLIRPRVSQRVDDAGFVAPAAHAIYIYRDDR